MIKLTNLLQEVKLNKVKLPKTPKISSQYKLAMKFLDKYPDSKWGSSDKKLQQRGDKFSIEVGSSWTENQYKKLIGEGDKLSELFKKWFFNLTPEQKDVVWDMKISPSEVVGSTKGMLTRAYSSQFGGSPYHS